MMRTIEPRLEVSENTVNVRRPRAWRGRVKIVRKGGFGVPLPAIGADHRSFLHILREKFSYRLSVGVWRDGQADAASPLGGAPVFIGIAEHLNSAEYQSVCPRSCHTPTEIPFNRASYNRFIGFNVTRQPGSRVTDHRTPQPVQHKPGGSVCAPNLTFKLFGTEPRCMCGNQISRPKPFLDAHMAPVQHRTGCRRRTSATARALVSEWFFDHPIPASATLRTHKSIRPSTLREILQTDGVGRELLPEFLQRLRKFWSSHVSMIQHEATLVKCISISTGYPLYSSR